MDASTESPGFNGYVRTDGRVGTRNYIGVLVVGNCAATAARQVAAWFTPKRLAAWPNVDGVVPFIHELGCGMEKSGEPIDLLRRTLGGIIRNPNIAGAVVLALGCERNNIYGFLEQEGLQCGPLLQSVVLQEVGGTRLAIDAGITAIESMLPTVNGIERRRTSLDYLVVGLLAEQAARDVAVHEAIGHAVDRLVAAGGTAIVTNTAASAPSLFSRASSTDIQGQLEQRVAWWRQHTQGRDTPLSRQNHDETPSSTLPHSGSCALQAVFGYAWPVPAKGLVMMDAPGHEAVASSGLVASGATLISMASRNASTCGAAGAPTLKLAMDHAQYTRFADDLDLDASAVNEGRVSVQQLGDVIFERWIACASGEKTASEDLGIGESEFVPWSIGVMA